MYRLPPKPEDKRDRNLNFRASERTLERLDELAEAHDMSQSECLDYWLGVAHKRPSSVQVPDEHPPRPKQQCIWISPETAEQLKALAKRKDVSQADLIEFFVNEAWKEEKGRTR